MCGITAISANKEALPFLLQGLEKLEYRGYDSAGITTIEGNHLFTKKASKKKTTTKPTGIKTNKIITIIINVKTIAPSKHLSAISYFSSIDSVTLVLYFSSHAFK